MFLFFIKSIINIQLYISEIYCRVFKQSLKTFIKEQIEELKFALWSICIQTTYYLRVHPRELEPDYNPDVQDDDYILNMYMPYILMRAITYKFFTPTPAWQKQAWNYLTGEYEIRYRTDEQYKISEHLRDQNLLDLLKKHDEWRAYQRKCRKELLEPNIELTYKLSAILKECSYTSNSEDKFTIMKIVIYSLYLRYWSYVLIVSILATSFSTMYTSIVITATDNIDPFSGLLLKTHIIFRGTVNIRIISRIPNILRSLDCSIYHLYRY